MSRKGPRIEAVTRDPRYRDLWWVTVSNLAHPFRVQQGRGYLSCTCVPYVGGLPCAHVRAVVEQRIGGDPTRVLVRSESG